MSIHGRTDLTFPYVSSHINYMLLELVKNSMRATVETHSVDAKVCHLHFMPYTKHINHTPYIIRHTPCLDAPDQDRDSGWRGQRGRGHQGVRRRGGNS
ncbi:hypothetical protein EON63_02595 [archaeon]|nr:MAG: hypothetical protein EON63_02595 [archaeon]